MKYACNCAMRFAAGSAPTRGPWIEMAALKWDFCAGVVGPHTGAVD